MSWAAVVFVLSFLAVVYFLRDFIRVLGSIEYKREAEMLRTRRRDRKASKR